MNNNHTLASKPARRFSMLGLAMAVVVGVCAAAGSVAVHAQATFGTIFGKAPTGATVWAQSPAIGIRRHVRVDAEGRYSLGHMPIGTYTVTLEENGQSVLQHANVGVTAGRGIQVNLECAQNQCADLASKQ